MIDTCRLSARTVDYLQYYDLTVNISPNNNSLLSTTVIMPPGKANGRRDGRSDNIALGGAMIHTGLNAPHMLKHI